MDVLRTAVVLILLLALGYGVWVVLNQESGVEDPGIDWGEGEQMAEAGFGEGPFIPPPQVESPSATPAPGGSSYPGMNRAIERPPAIPSEAGPPYGAATTTAPALGAADEEVAEASGATLPPPPPGFAATAEPAQQPPPAPGQPAMEEGVAGTSVDNNVEPAAADVAAPPIPPASSPLPPNSTPIPQDVAVDGPPPPTSSPIGQDAASSANSTESHARLATPSVAEAKATAERQIAEGEHYGALYTLSLAFGDPSHTAAEQKELVDMLDPLAAKVIYSTQHLLEPPHQVRRGEDLNQIAEQMKVPVKLLQNINGVTNPMALTPGTSLKIVQGPFRAEVDLTRKELILFLGRLYAGRFPISVGSEPAPRSGEYTIRGKERGKAYYGPSGATFAADHPNNPFGRFWLDLGSQVAIHGTAASGDNQGRGCVSLSPVDAEDVFGILSVGSQVVIRR